MSQYLTDTSELLKTVQQYVSEIGAKLKGGDKYNALVAAYLLSICEREVRLGPFFDIKEKKDIIQFLKSGGSLEDLQRILCEGIREGKYDENWNELLDLILAQTVNSVAVVRPDHLDEDHGTVESRT